MNSVIDLILHSEKFADWLSQFLIGLLIVWLGSRVSDVRLEIEPPDIIISLIKIMRTPYKFESHKLIVDGGVLVLQLTGVVMCLLSFFVWFGDSHQQSMQFFLRGTVITFVLSTIWIFGGKLLYK